VAEPHNKQLQRTVISRHMRTASASFNYAHAARWFAQGAAAELALRVDAMLPFGFHFVLAARDAHADSSPPHQPRT
jgi:hypothetical protein